MLAKYLCHPMLTIHLCHMIICLSWHCGLTEIEEVQHYFNWLKNVTQMEIHDYNKLVECLLFGIVYW